MPNTFVQNAPSLDEARKLYRRASKVIKRAQKARKATKAVAKKRRPVSRRSLPIKQPAPIAAKKSWLSKPVKVRKITSPPAVTSKLGYRPPTSRISMPALKGVSARPVAGEWNGVDLIPVISSNVASFGYNPEESMLVTAFLDGSIYEYYNVPLDVWQRFQTAPSKGKFVWKELRDMYEYQRVR